MAYKGSPQLIRKSGPFLIWLLLVSLLFLVPFEFFPNPLATTKQWLIHDVKDNQDQGEEKICDLFKGKWVRDFGGPPYTNQTCKTMPESKNCGKYGKEQDYANWRWKPDGCELPRFDSAAFLDIVRGRRLAFVGDSVARNQMESLLCLLSQVETPQDLHKDAEDRFRTWYFPSHNFTLMTLWTKFLVQGKERVINGSNSGVFDLHLDKIDANWYSKVNDLDYIVMSAGHWFFRKNYLYEEGKLIGCVFCSDGNLTDYGVSFAVRRAFRTSLHFIHNCKECESTQTFLRTFAPAHFESGMWNSGGYCNKTSPSNEEDVKLSGTEWDLRSAQVEEIEKIQGEDYRRGKKQFRVLDVTRAMMMRADAHPGTHWNNEWNPNMNDCVHWCMPGPIDVWNDLLLEELKGGRGLNL